MLRLRPLLIVIAAVSCLAQGGAGGVSGAVSGASGIAMSGVKVTVSDAASKPVASGETDTAGVYRLSGIAAGKYQMEFSAAGFTGAKLESITIAAGQVLSLPATVMRPEAKQETLGDVVRIPAVDTERVQQADTILLRQVRDLPINRRNYLNLATLTPAVAEVNDYVGITDAPLVQAPQSGLSFGGNNGRGNIFWLDGGENYINSGGVRPSISQEAVAEFRVDRSNYSAEFGGGIGGIVNIVSKGGGNDFHGNAFGFLRHRSIQARNYFVPEKGAFTRTQSGGTLGGPIMKNKTYFFAAFERLQRAETTYVGILRDRSVFTRLTKSQEDLVSFLSATNQPFLQALASLSRQGLTTTTFPATVALFNANSGAFPFSERNTLGSLRIDHRFSDNHNAFLRFNAGNGDSQNSDAEGLNGFNRGVISDFSDQTLMINDTFVINAKLVSESRLSFNRYRYNVANRDRVGPSIEINGFGYFGKDWTLPGRLHEWHGQFQQNMFYATGKHSIRFGVDVNPVRDAVTVETNIGGRFSFGEYLPLGQLYNQFTGDATAADSLAATLRQLGGARLAPNLNDPISALQAFNLGVPAFYIQGFGNPTWDGWFKRYNFFVNDVIRVTPKLTMNVGLRYDLESNPDPLSTDANNFAPRFGLAWTPFDDHKTVVRAGYGMFYLRTNAQNAVAIDLQSGKKYNQVIVPLTGLPGVNSSATGQPLTSADVYQTLLAQNVIGTRAINAADLRQFGITPGPNFPFQILFLKPTNFVNAYSQQTSLEIERAIGDFAVSAAYNFNRAAHLPRLRDTNLQYGPPGLGGVPRLVPSNPFISQLIATESAANSFYHALILQVARRLERRLVLNASYTLSKSIDESTDLQFIPNNSLNPRQDRGLSTFDQRHRFVASAVIDLPGSGKRKDGPMQTIFGGFVLSPLVLANTGRPFNLLIGQDPNTRPAYAGRNIGHGPAYADVDLRLSRRIQWGKIEARNIEFIAEGFNMLNHTNFRRLNNVVGQVTVDQLPRPIVGTKGRPSDPLSFLSAFDPRQFQFALKIHF
ncbi:MAG: TonB-dependent receptor [Candidatus Solibacter usitatus]|nr:TonB-dependent receptor [Candidatus Solibacter usitatus]